MTNLIDETHDVKRQSWVASANGHTEFPLQNLPIGIFAPHFGLPPRGGIAIGEKILDLAAALEAGLFSGEAARAAQAAALPTLNRLMALGPSARRALRQSLFALLDAENPQRAQIEAPPLKLLHDATDCQLYLPAVIGDYTDFYAGIHHAANVGRFFRPDNPLLPNYKYVPIGYHGRASSVRPSGDDVYRPSGQRKRAEEMEPTFGPSRNLDYELELGFFIGPGNALGTPIPIEEAGEQIVGLCLLNDWSARDIQAWEYQPLGPFIAKNFHTTISPWIVTTEALAPFRTAQAPRPKGDPPPLPYLFNKADQAQGAFTIELEVFILTPQMRTTGMPPHRLSFGKATELYWTLAQLIAHHSSNGCNLTSGDLLGTGTISSSSPKGYGSLLELTKGGKEPLTLTNGEMRGFLEDGDEIIMSAHARRPGYAPIGFGECRATVRQTS